MRLKRIGSDTTKETDVSKLMVAESASPALFVQKKNESVRFCVDYLWRYGVTLEDSCHISDMD